MQQCKFNEFGGLISNDFKSPPLSWIVNLFHYRKIGLNNAIEDYHDYMIDILWLGFLTSYMLLLGK